MANEEQQHHIVCIPNLLQSLTVLHSRVRCSKGPRDCCVSNLRSILSQFPSNARSDVTGQVSFTALVAVIACLRHVLCNELATAVVRAVYQ